LTVVFHHHLLVFPAVAHWVAEQPTGIAALLFFPPVIAFWAGHAAVLLFFILSVFVLALPILENRQPIYRHYLLKRICRIYVPYIVALAGAVLGVIFISRGRVPELSDWFQSSWTTPVTLRSLLDHTFLIGSFETRSYNDVIWSLVHEMRISLVFPILGFWVARKPGSSSMIGIFVLFFGGWALSQAATRFFHSPSLESLALSVHYAAFFILGALLAKHRRMLSAWIQRMPRWGVFCLTAMSLAAYSWEGLTSHARVGHFGHAPLALLLVCSVFSSFIVAGIMHRLVEVPAIQLGKDLCTLFPAAALEAPGELRPGSAIQPIPPET
jgi:peptidoglycan/LPS O-acetylase OafA/YrhL